MSERTIVVPLTAGGRGAVASLLVVGPQAEAWVSERFESASSRRLAEQGASAVNFGYWTLGEESRGDAETRREELREEVVVRRVSAERLEVHCHGGHSSVSAVLESLEAAGAQRETWQHWLAREAEDPIRAAAQVQLAQATTERAALVLLDQFHGALRREIDEIAALDDTGEALPRIQRLLARGRQVGRHLTEPWQVVLTGVPNVGKSSLINALLGYQRAIVFDEPGTTRDVVAAQTAIDGWPVELSDTAGLRDSADAIEAAGVAHAQQRLAAADLIVWVRDAGQPETARPALPADVPVIAVDNKCDLPAARDSEPGVLRVSAVTGDGLRELVAVLGSALVADPPPAGAAVPFLAEHLAWLSEARDTAAAGDLPGVRAALAKFDDR